MPVEDFHECRVLEAGPQENPDEVAVHLAVIGEDKSIQGWRYARGRNASAVLAAALTAMSMSSTVGVSLHDDGSIARFNVRRQ